MKNSISDQAFFIESEDYEEDKDSIRGEDDRNDSEISNYSDDNPEHQRKPSSLNPSWPQCYRLELRDLTKNIHMAYITILVKKERERNVSNVHEACFANEDGSLH
ncbi:unnamed protein product [Lactuca saligna]|uniref:Uncharacterized protein n=1 Tax=Lactuca saligna TaxID=75948 RepID=A0AA35ZUY5_LACSI|nr:unnamed protein product [Lactuca saligna]